MSHNPAAHTYTAHGLPSPPRKVEHDQGAPAALQYPRAPARYHVEADGSLFVRETLPVSFEARIHDLGHGQIEATTRPIYRWSEVEPLSEAALLDYSACLANPVPLSPGDLLALIEANEKRSNRRACTKVRRLAKWKRLDTMITLTYRENQTDRELMQRHHAAFVRRVKKAIPGFEYVSVFERQKRGCWHAHMAVARIKSGYWVKGSFVHSWKLLRSIWRSVIAADGNIDVKAPGRPNRSIAKLASYLTKYICKDLHLAAKYQNSYCTSGADLPDAVCIDMNCTAQEALVNAILLCVPEWAKGRLHQSPQLASGGYFFSIDPGD